MKVHSSRNGIGICKFHNSLQLIIIAIIGKKRVVIILANVKQQSPNVNYTMPKDRILYVFWGILPIKI